ncbi:short chain dehydrogenase [Streptomyces griseoaurantiacus]|uniref:short chain dehydrogenase n=1 Tax=Streptomyces TaxID=1883 RepID=UPI0029BC7C66|nr:MULTISPECIES: short chain dehydrogenase [Streptomyces]MDX3361292.1 short chain dehydrogenase [Streptomyces sp. ME02-6978.2a]
MRILLIGAGGTLGGAVRRTLVERGHEVIGVGRSGGDLVADVTDPEAVTRLYAQAGPLDAVAVAAGEAVFRPLGELTPEDALRTFHGKVLAQMDLVRQGIRHVAPNGSFTLVSGILAEEPIPASAAAAAANGAVEAYVRAAAIELPPRRINVVSPTVVEESLAAYGPLFPGVEPAPVSRVATAYVRSVEGAGTGRTYRVR